MNYPGTWWRHQMETFPRYWPFLRGIRRSPVNSRTKASVDVFIDLRLNIRLSKQSWGWWFETLSRPLWRHSNKIKVLRWSSWRNCEQIRLNFVSGFRLDETVSFLATTNKSQLLCETCMWCWLLKYNLLEIKLKYVSPIFENLGLA